MKQMLLKCYCGNTIKAYGNNASCSVCGRSYYKAYPAEKTLVVFNGTKEVNWLPAVWKDYYKSFTVPSGTIVLSAKIDYIVEPDRALALGTMAFSIALDGVEIKREIWDYGQAGKRSGSIAVSLASGSHEVRLRWTKADISPISPPIYFRTYVAVIIEYEGEEPYQLEFPPTPEEEAMKWALIIAGAGVVGFLGIRAIEAMRKK
jgi:hypothetical protein